MNPLIALAEQYYKVAEDLRWRADEMRRTSEMLARMADDMSEKGAALTPMPGAPDPTEV